MTYQQSIKQSNDQFTENDVALARELSRSVSNGHRWEGISKEMLSISNRISDEELYKTFDTNEKDFWFKIKNFTPYEQTWKLFSNAIMDYNKYMGSD